MTKLIAALAILAALAWAVTATASWITRKKAPLALGAGKSAAQPTPAEQDRAMLRAQWRSVAAIVFAVVMFAALLRISVGLSGQAGLPIAMTGALSATGGLLLLSALPATRLTPARALLPRRAAILPAAILAAFTAFTLATELLPEFSSVKHDGVPLLLATLALGGSALLVLHRLNNTALIDDPRMRTLDLRWRELSARNVLRFTSGSLLACFGTSAILAAVAINTAAQTAATHAAAANAAAQTAAAAPSPVWAIACAAGGAALAVAGVVLLVMAARGALTQRTEAREASSAPITA